LLYSSWVFGSILLFTQGGFWLKKVVIAITVFTTFILGAYLYYDNNPIRAVNNNLDASGIKLLQSRNEVIQLLGPGERLPHLGFGSIYYYKDQGLKVNIDNNQVIGLVIEKTQNSFMNISVGMSHSEATGILLKEGFKQTNDVFSKGRISVQLDAVDEIIVKIHIWYLGEEYQNRIA